MAKDYIHLKVEGTRGGVVKGESQDAKHADEIELLAFSWEMRSPREAITKQAVGRLNYGNLVVHKRIDSASTALMSMMATNEEIKKAVLTVRRAGIEAADYLAITLSKAFVVAYVLDAGDSSEARLGERVEFAYESIEVAYSGQSAAGVKRGSSSFIGSAGGKR